MTTIKRFNPDYIMHAARFEPFARETEHGEFVRFEDHQQVVSALEAERDALAVENQALKDVVGECQAYFIAGIRNTIRPVNEGYLLMRCDTVDDETPATDAALAAIQAQGVEKLADKLDAEIEQIMRGAFFYDEISSREAISKMVRAFATELREAK
ncbi:hypothetical protein [Serratia marcescens]|uniref:hypothetical protein n=1 Tax=Serratia marcescens TaxID=615 RepID=UPI0027E4AE97|nr:hypothetical protein [Serratia marcescens]MDH2270143.1 hypothetical protein [Serratia marcescens]MDH2278120.1 hypothetical protein [Serratia marcescens]